MKINYRIRNAKSINNITPLIIIHGLFGNLNNLNTIATYLNMYYNVIQIDLRNHGHSPHDSMMTYITMSQDILNLLDYLLIKKCIVIGHSIGGKVAMALNILYPNRIEKIIVIDIAPIQYDIQKNKNIFHAIEYINKLHINNKKDARYIMKNNNITYNVIEFLLKSFRLGLWDFNFNSIKKNYKQINGWSLHECGQKPALFIKGSLSPYIQNSNIQIIYQQFPQACIKIAPNSGHWVHYDNPKFLINTIYKFINSY